MKLTLLTVVVLFSASAFAHEMVQSQNPPAPQAPGQPRSDYDKALRDTVGMYKVWGETEKYQLWRATVCSSDGEWAVASFMLKQKSPDRFKTLSFVRKSMHKYLSLAKKDAQKATDQIWQDWHAIPDSEKEAMGAMQGKGSDFALELAFDCSIDELLINNNMDKDCSANGETFDLHSLRHVCINLGRTRLDN